MPAPTLDTFAARLYEELGPLAYADVEHGYALAHYCAAIGRMFQTVEDLARERPEGPGWSILVDLDRAPDYALEWLGQLVGVRALPNLTAAQMRERIAATDGYQRGTLAAIAGAPLPYLTGTRTVYITERHGSAYHLTIATRAAETPDPAAVERAIREQKPAGLALTYSVLAAGATYAALHATQADYAEVLADFTDYADVLSDPTQ